MVWWLFNKSKGNGKPEGEQAEPATEELDIEDEETTQEMMVDMFIDDLPESIKKDKEFLKKIRKSDKRAKEVYDDMDENIEQLKALRVKIQAKNASKK